MLDLFPDPAPSDQRKLVIENIGLLLSGRLEEPILDADTIVAVGGMIVEIGKASDCDTDGADIIVDACGTTVCPGLIDGHTHPTFGEYSPRTDNHSWIFNCLHGGTTTMISAGEVHIAGRPSDRIGVKALAIAAQRSFSAARPAGVKMIAGAPLLEEGLLEEDFQEMAEAGIELIGEVGIGSVADVETASRMVAWARANGMRSLTHTGGPSIPGSRLMAAEEIIEIDPDVIGHINGGHTAFAHSEIRCLCEGCSRAIEIVHNGNSFAALYALRLATEMGQLERIVLGTDGPSGAGVPALGMLRMIAMLASFGELPAEKVFCFATGNTARVHQLPQGVIAPDRPADLLIMDRAQGTAGRTLLESVELGDLPGIGMVLIDGVPLLRPSRNTPPATVLPTARRVLR
ncbi:amidohydrolase family protein [Saliniramus sp.]|uniref:amidohydrolase family protein n=1 Tax=Saliniramus sp. TaxID=2986772 RepID=UPI002C46F04E|nr:amidohydrolase family protein [Saliniramus sp.]HMB11978.1 amidohydrolase family protein [Saliniramus sp.]